jgi:outer membrane cobalamin receptor
VLRGIELTWFDNRFRDLVDYLMTSFDPITWAVKGTYINSEREFARGVEANMRLQPFRHFTLSGGYNYIDTRFQESLTRPFDPVVSGKLTLLRRPKHSGSASLMYTHSRFDLFLQETYIGKRNDVNPVYIFGAPTILPNGSFNKLDLGLNYRIHPHILFITRIDNLLNQRYEEVLGYPAYRLNFSSGLKIQLGGR